MKILFLDIEVSSIGMEVFSTSIRNPRGFYPPPENIRRPEHILCFSAGWYPDRARVIFRSVFHHGHDKMMLDLWNLMDEADVIVTYNGPRFDIPKVNTY